MMATSDQPTRGDDSDEENAGTEDCDNGRGTQVLTNDKEYEDPQDGSLGELIEKDIREDELMKVVSEVLEARNLTESRPLPVLVRAKEVDLLKLSVQVRAYGGYEKVTTWSSVSRSMGFGPNAGPMLKLVYVKYLRPLENRRLVTGQARKVDKIHNKDLNQTAIESAKTSAKGQGASSSKKRKFSDTDEKPGMELASVVEPPVIQSSSTISATTLAEFDESLAGMLEWVKRLASNPGDPKKGHGSRVSRGNEALVEKYVTLARKVRTILWKNGENALSPRSESPVHSKKRARAR